jgi:hypothetical protein
MIYKVKNENMCNTFCSETVFKIKVKKRKRKKRRTAKTVPLERKAEYY